MIGFTREMSWASDPLRTRRARAVFDEVADLGPIEREDRLANLCGSDHALRVEVESLLAYDATPGDVVAEIVEQAAQAVADRTSLRVGQTLLHYTVTEAVGRQAPDCGPTDSPPHPEMAGGGSLGGRDLDGDRHGYTARGRGLATARQRVPALRVRPLGPAMAASVGHRRHDCRAVRRRHRPGIRASGRCGAVPPGMAGPHAVVRAGTPPDKTPLIEFGRHAAEQRKRPMAAQMPIATVALTPVIVKSC